MTKSVIITSDSAFDLPPELVKKYNIYVSPLTIILDDKNYHDCVDIFPDDIYSTYNEKGILPKTTAVSPGEYAEFFKKILSDDCEIVHFNLGSGFSTTHNNARLACADLDGIYLVDSENLSVGISLLLLKACEMRDKGLSAKEIAEKSSKLTPLVRSSFVLDTLEFLYKGGRCSAVAALGANLLKLKPCIEVTKNKMTVGKKYRGKLDGAFDQYIKDKLEKVDEIDKSRAFLVHSGLPDDMVENIRTTINKCITFDELITTTAGCTISSHCGPNTFGLMYMLKDKETF